MFGPDENNMIVENSINNNSLVMKFNYYNQSILFTGDIEKSAENFLVKNYKEYLNSTVLKVAHHGSNTSTTERFLYSVNPRISLIGVGKRNRFGHPNDEVIKRIEEHGTNIYRTDQNGEILLKLYKDGKIETKKCIE